MGILLWRSLECYFLSAVELTEYRVVGVCQRQVFPKFILDFSGLFVSTRFSVEL